MFTTQCRADFQCKIQVRVFVCILNYSYTGCSANKIQVRLQSKIFSSGFNKTVYEFLIQTDPLNPGTIIALIDFGRNINTSMVQFSGGVKISSNSYYIDRTIFFLHTRQD
jgi:hypothetical protein